MTQQIKLEINSLWAKWIFVFSFVVIIGGIFFAFVSPYFLPQSLELFFIEITGTGFDTLTSAEIRFHNLLSGVIGGTMFGWGLMILFLGFRLLKQPEDWIWTAVAISTVGWIICDTLASVLAESSLNVLLNTSILLLALPPLIAMRNSVISGFRNIDS